jgi:hypothetical protein
MPEINTGNGIAFKTHDRIREVIALIRFDPGFQAAAGSAEQGDGGD